MDYQQIFDWFSKKFGNAIKPAKGQPNRIPPRYIARAAHYHSVVKGREVKIEYAQGWKIAYLSEKDGTYVDPRKEFKIISSKIRTLLKHMGYTLRLRPVFFCGTCIGFRYTLGKDQKVYRYVLMTSEIVEDMILKFVAQIVEYLNNEIDDYDIYLEHKARQYSKDASQHYWSSPEFFREEGGDPFIYVNDEGLATQVPLPIPVVGPRTEPANDSPKGEARRIRADIALLAKKNRARLIPFTRRAGYLVNLLAYSDINRKYRFIEVVPNPKGLYEACNQMSFSTWKIVRLQRRLWYDAVAVTNGYPIIDPIDKIDLRKTRRNELMNLMSMLPKLKQTKMRLPWENYVSYLSVPDAIQKLALNMHDTYCAGVGCLGCKEIEDEKEDAFKAMQAEFLRFDLAEEARIDYIVLMEKKLNRAINNYQDRRKILFEKAPSLVPLVDDIVKPAVLMTQLHLEWCFRNGVDECCNCCDKQYSERVHHHDSLDRYKICELDYDSRKQDRDKVEIVRDVVSFDFSPLPAECRDIFVGFEVDVRYGSDTSARERLWCECTDRPLSDCLDPLGVCFKLFSTRMFVNETWEMKKYCVPRSNEEGVEQIAICFADFKKSIDVRDVVLPSYCDPFLFSDNPACVWPALRVDPGDQIPEHYDVCRDAPISLDDDDDDCDRDFDGADLF